MKVIPEQDALDHSEGLYDGYAQSKWVAEKLMMTARSRGIPVCIYRLGMITGHSQTGVSQTDDMMCRMIKGFIELGCARLGFDGEYDSCGLCEQIYHPFVEAERITGESFSLGQSSPVGLEQAC